MAVITAGGCQNTPNPPATTTTPAVATTTPKAEPTPGTSAPAKTLENQGARPAFDGVQAFAQLKKQCDFGPRYVGSEGHAKLRDYLVSEMKKFADETIAQDFTYRGLKLTNVLGVFYPAGATAPSKNPVLLMAHWDTRPVADSPLSSEVQKGAPFQYGPKGWNRLAPIMGANDGASGVAALLELARLFKEKKPAVGVVILLDDGEDYGDFRANGGAGEGVLLGARHFAKHFREQSAVGLPAYGILLDIVGAKNLIIPREANSQRFAPGTNEKVFGIAQSLGYSETFRANEWQEVEDDHVPINQAGIPMIDLIHPLPFGDYAKTGYIYWHTLEDTPDKCSPQSLKIVGETIAEVLYSETPGP